MAKVVIMPQIPATPEKYLVETLIVRDLSKKGRCDACRFWNQSENNAMMGRCPVLGILLWPDESNTNMEVSITTSPHTRKPVSDVSAVRTERDFGCYHFE